MGRENGRNLRQPLLDTGLLLAALEGGREIVRGLAAKCITRCAGVAPPLPFFDELLGAERNKHAEDNDADFPGEHSPAMKRSWQFDGHQLLAPKKLQYVTEQFR